MNPSEGLQIGNSKEQTRPVNLSVESGIEPQICYDGFMKKEEAMKKKMTRKMAAALAGMTLLSAVSVCGSTVAMADEASDPVEITIAIWNADEAFSAGDEVLTTIEEKLGIKITPVNLTWDDYTQKVQLWASSGSLPDVFVGDIRNSVTYSQWADQGVIHAIPDDLSAYPALEAYLSGNAAQEAKLGGTLYCIPRQTYASQEWTATDRIISYRWDLAQKAGITEEPTTWEEFSDMILAIIEADPDGTGITGVTSDGNQLLGGMIMPYVSSIIEDNGSAFKWIETEDGTYKPAYFTEDVVAGFRLARDLYDSGVIDADVALATTQSAKEKFLQGKSAAIFNAGGYGNMYSTVALYWEDIHGTSYTDDVKAFVLPEDMNGNPSYPVWNYAWSESFISSTVDDVKLDKILSLYDYLISDEGAFFGTYGPEGENYSFDENGKVVLNKEYSEIVAQYPSLNAFMILVRWNPSNYDDRFVADVPEEYVAVNKAIAEKAATVEIPAYSVECTQAVMSLEIEFTVNFNEDFLYIMTGTDPVEDMWAELLAQYEADGLNEMIEQVNAEVGK